MYLNSNDTQPPPCCTWTHAVIFLFIALHCTCHDSTIFVFIPKSMVENEGAAASLPVWGSPPRVWLINLIGTSRVQIEQLVAQWLITLP
jgi:hypothetical protein